MTTCIFGTDLSHYCPYSQVLMKDPTADSEWETYTQYASGCGEG